MNQQSLPNKQPNHKPITCAEIVAQFEKMHNALITTDCTGIWSMRGNVRLEVALIITPDYMPDYYWYIYEDHDYDLNISGYWSEIYEHFRPVLEVS